MKGFLRTSVIVAFWLAAAYSVAFAFGYFVPRVWLQ